MNLATLLIPPSLDAKQALRLRRLGLAALSYLSSTALVAVTWLFGVLPAAAMMEVALAYLAINLGVYAAIRSGFNLRFADPSLTRFQVLSAISVLMFIVYHMDDGRNIALFGCFVVFLFGVFRFNMREFTFVTLYTLAAYALVINLLMHLRPQTIRDVPLEWMSWLVLAGLLPGFGIIGGQINTLRRRLRESELRFRAVAELSSDWYWEQDANFRFTVMSGGLENKGKFVINEALGKPRWELPIELDDAEWAKHRATLQAHRAFTDFEYQIAVADGSLRWYSVRGEPQFDARGKFTGYRGTANDITARKQTEQALRESIEKLRLFTDNIPAMTVYWDENLRCSFANKVFIEFFGLAGKEIIGKHVREVLGEESYRKIEGHFLRAMQGHPVSYQRASVLANGETRHIEVTLLPQFGDQGRFMGCFAVTTDVTEHKLAEERIQRVAHHDSLTNLPNRLLFNDRLNQAVRLAKRDSRQFALLFLDLDKFKPVNDTLGHGAGDALLQALAARIRHQVRESDTVARIGGDEFTVILPEIARREEAEIVAIKIIAALGVPFELGAERTSVEIGASIGIAVYPADGDDADALVKAADAAMYEAKQAGGTYRFFEARK
ncbi:MAG: diguanylate cyclase [Burkholderiales bacterium]|nr:diguanylate cyclase [Burkholderiales bacterium]